MSQNAANLRWLIHEGDRFAECAGKVLFSPDDFGVSVTQTADWQARGLSVGKFAYQGQALNVWVIRRADVGAMPDMTFSPLRDLIAWADSDTAQLLTKARQLLRWQDEHKFCSRCGSPTQTRAESAAAICPKCRYRQYPRIQPCTITAVLRTIDGAPHILLAQHHRAQQSGMYSLLAGFVEVGETLEQCAMREVGEEVGIVVNNLRYLTSQPWAYPSNLMVGFVADFVSGDIVWDVSELTDARFFDLAKLNTQDNATPTDDSPRLPAKGTISRWMIEQLKQQLTK